MKYLKITLAALLTLVLLLFLGAGLVLHFVNPNDYQGRIAEAVEKAIGRKLHFEGNIELSYYPWLGLKVGALWIEDSPKFGSKPFLRLREAGLKLDTWALLRGQVLVDEVLLDGVELRLLVSQTGEKNWEFKQDPAAYRGNLAESPAAPTSGTVSGAAPGTSDLASRKLDLAINKILLSDAQVSFEDFKSNSSYVVRLNNAVVDDFVLGEDFNISLDGCFADQSSGLRWAYDLAGRVKGVQGGGKMELSDVLLKNIIKLPNLPEAGLKADLQVGSISFNPEDKTLAVNTLKLNLPGSIFHGQLQGSLADAAADGSLLLAGSVRLESSPKILLAALGRPWADNAGMEKLNLDLTLSLRGSTLDLQKLDGELDNSHLTGTGQVELDKGPRIQLTAKLDQLDVDRYLAGLSQSGTAASEGRAVESRDHVSPGVGDNGGAESGKVAGRQPATDSKKSAGKPFLESMVLSASLQIGKLTVQQLALQNIKVPVQATNGVFFFKPVTFDFYQGKFNGAARINLASDSRGSSGRNSLNSSLNQLDVAQLLNALGKKQLLESGIASIKTDLTFNGLGWPEISRSLGGSSSLNFNSGILSQTLIKLIASFTDQVPNLPEIRRIDSLSASFKFNNGVGTNPDLALKSPSLNGSGSGTVNLPASRLDYRLRVQNIPLIVSGPFSSPSVSVDAAAAVRGVLENPETIQKVLNHPSGAKKGAQEMLKGIFGGGRK